MASMAAGLVSGASKDATIIPVKAFSPDKLDSHFYMDGSFL